MINPYLLALEDFKEKLNEYHDLLDSLELSESELAATDRVLTDVRRIIFDLEEDVMKNGNNKG